MTIAPPHLVVVGPTASGKSALALALARQRPGTEIISADSMLVYRGMDIGTAKPSPEERAEVPHHLIDVVDPAELFSVGAYQKLAGAALCSIEERGKRAIIVGGTGLYVQAVVDDWDIPGEFPDVRAELERTIAPGPGPGATVEAAAVIALHTRLAQLDPLAASRMEPNNTRRVLRALEVTLGSGRPFSSFGPGLTAYPLRPRFVQVGLRVERPELDVRITRRYQHQLAAGFVEEVAELTARPSGLSRTAAQALGYRELAAHLRGELTLDEAVKSAITRTCQFARRQDRWFRRDPRTRWVEAPGDAIGNSVAQVHALLGDWA